MIDQKVSLKGKLSEIEAGCRDGRSTRDHIFLLNLLTNKEIKKRKKEGNYIFRLLTSKLLLIRQIEVYFF